MRLTVTGQNGQVALALQALAGREGLIVTRVGRPEFDLARPATVKAALAASQPDVIVNAAAFTAVDLAEAEKAEAFAVNAVGAGLVGEAAAALGVPLIQLSTDYVFDGRKGEPYVEADTPDPQTVYGQTKLDGERRVRQATADHVILRLAWVYSATGRNFVRTMLRLGEQRHEIGVVEDQVGNPTAAADIAAGIHAVAVNLLARRGDPLLRGVFHMAAGGDASWADVAEAVFEGSAARRGPQVRVKRISTEDYPTPARRPANSRLDCGWIRRQHGVRLPDWRGSLDACLTELLGEKQHA